MIPIFKSLEQISTGYTVFEKDQVLTHEQLNSLADYADDQIRLTRVRLLGTGIACGLRATIFDEGVAVSKGMGVTTDGDIIAMEQVTYFTHYRVYDESFPAYAPFYSGDISNGMVRAYELLTGDAGDGVSWPLSEFLPREGWGLTNMVAVLLMESYLKDDDICSGTDCDNLGKEAISKVRCILVDYEIAGQLMENMQTVNYGFRITNPILADRPVLTSAVNSPAAIGSLYRTTCTSLHGKIVAEFNRLNSSGWPYLDDLYEPAALSYWVSLMEGIKSSFAANDTAIQYYYDFLKDVAETYNALCDLLFGDTTQCVPGIAAFPKHLMLGYVIDGPPSDDYRTRFYPSPITGHTAGERDHAGFLVRKLDMMIRNFSSAATAADIRITPSSHEDVPLEERAIPFYYPANSSNRLFDFWNFRLSERGRGALNYSYNAAAYASAGGISDPFRLQIGRFPFFRIEGHLGKQVTTALARIKDLIKANNVPIAVRAIMAGTNRAQVTVKPVMRSDALYSVHRVLRQDLANQLDDVKVFSNAFNVKVQAEPSTATTSVEDCDCPSIRLLSANSSADVVAKAAVVQDKLVRNYTAYAADASWQTSLKNTMETAGQFKSSLSAVVKTDFATPYDTLISSTHATLLPLLDQVIKQKEERADERLLLGTFIDRNPGVEHFAGVSRGGTFLLVYDSSNTVIADFMVPYYLPEEEVEPVDDLTLVKPAVRPTYVVDSGIKVQPSRNTFLNTKLDAAVGQVTASVVGVMDTKFAQHNAVVDGKLIQQNAVVDGKILQQTASVDRKIQEQDLRVSFQGDYVGLFRDSVQMLGSTVPRADQLKSAAPGTETSSISDPYLAMRVDENVMFAEKIAVLQELASDMTLDEETRWRYTQEGQETEYELAESILLILRYIISAKMSVTGTGDGAQAVAAIFRGLPQLSNDEAKGQLRKGLDEVIRSTSDKNIHTVCRNIASAI